MTYFFFCFGYVYRVYPNAIDLYIDKYRFIYYNYIRYLYIKYIIETRFYIMASAKKTLNPLTDTPENKVEVTKPFMIAYMESEKATQEDVNWFIDVIQNPENRKQYTNRLNGEKYDDINIPKVRELFCKRFYPELNAKKKTALTFTDRILAIKK